jgi:hypothetical protein
VVAPKGQYRGTSLWSYPPDGPRDLRTLGSQDPRLWESHSTITRSAVLQEHIRVVPRSTTHMGCPMVKGIRWYCGVALRYMLARAYASTTHSVHMCSWRA